MGNSTAVVPSMASAWPRAWGSVRPYTTSVRPCTTSVRPCTTSVCPLYVLCTTLCDLFAALYDLCTSLYVPVHHMYASVCPLYVLCTTLCDLFAALYDLCTSPPGEADPEDAGLLPPPHRAAHRGSAPRRDRAPPPARAVRGPYGHKAGLVPPSAIWVIPHCGPKYGSSACPGAAQRAPPGNPTL